MKRISKKSFLLELAKVLTTCRAHCDDGNPNHGLVVKLAYIAWMLYRKDGKLDDSDLDDIRRVINSL